MATPGQLAKQLGVIKLKMLVGVEWVKPPAWGRSPQTPTYN